MKAVKFIEFKRNRAKPDLKAYLTDVFSETLLKWYLNIFFKQKIILGLKKQFRIKVKMIR